MLDLSDIETQRLRLRPIAETEAAAIQKTASTRAIADTMISIPHPYPTGEANRYIARQQADHKAGNAVTYTIEMKENGVFCGLIELRAIDCEHSQGELSFWLDPAMQGRGYMSEVVHAMVRYGFIDLGLNRLYAYHMVRNPASGHVLKKNGFRQEGLLRQRVRKWEIFEDVALWAILREDWDDQLIKKD